MVSEIIDAVWVSKVFRERKFNRVHKKGKRYLRCAKGRIPISKILGLWLQKSMHGTKGGIRRDYWKVERDTCSYCALSSIV